MSSNNPKVTFVPTGARLRQLAFAYLGRREYSKQMLTDKLLETGADLTEVRHLVEELADSCYQSDARMASMTVRSNLRRGRGQARATGAGAASRPRAAGRAPSRT